MGWGWVQCSRGRAGWGSVSVPVQTSSLGWLQNRGHVSGGTSPGDTCPEGRKSGGECPTFIQLFMRYRPAHYITLQSLGPNSTTRTPPTDKVATILQLVQQIHHQRTKIYHVPTSRHVQMLCSGIAMWQICYRTSCRIVVSLTAAGVRVVEFGAYSCFICSKCSERIFCCWTTHSRRRRRWRCQ